MGEAGNALMDITDFESEWADVPLPNEPDVNSARKPVIWEPVDLGPYLRGEVKPLTPSVGVYRTDGQQLLYPGLEHSVIAHTASGKTWFALACVTAEILAGNNVVYLHFEEASALSTVERLRRIGLSPEGIDRHLLFVSPTEALPPGEIEVQQQSLAPLLAANPTLVVVDGVNEAMVLHGQKIDLEGWSLVRRRLIDPFKRAGVTILECDHLPMSSDPLRGDAYGTVHKGNVVDGVRFALVRKERFGRGRRGRAALYSTKDRNGQVELHGSDNDGGAVYLGTLTVDDTDTTPDFLTLYAPSQDGESHQESSGHNAELANIVYEVVAALPEQSVASQRMLFTAMRNAGHQYRDVDVRKALDDLVFTGRLDEFSGRRGAAGYRIPSTASQESAS